MQRRVFTTVLFTIALALPAGPFAPGAAAQVAGDQGRWHPAWGDWSIAFSVPSGGGVGLGLWRQAGRNTAFGVVLDGAFEYETLEDPVAGDIQLTQGRVALGPALKRYWWGGGPVSPFLHAGANVSYEHDEAPGVTMTTFGGGVSLGLGADWFPTEGLSIGGHTGVVGSYFLNSDDDDATGDRSRVLVDLFTSSFSLHLYF